MRNIVAFCLIIFFFSCDKKEKTEETPLEVIDSLNVVDGDAYQVEDILVFKVQIAALKNNHKKLEILDGIDVSYEGDLIKYRLGNFNTYQEARSYRRELLGVYKGAFVQALKNDAPIHITAALQQ